MDYEEIKKLAKILEESSLKKIFVKTGDNEIELEKESTYHAPVHQIIPANETSQNEKKKVEGFFVTSPMVGTFYSRSAPDQDTFVKVGQSISEDTVVCIIEAMKVMNEVKSGKTGILKEILMDDGHPVEFGSKMFLIE
jgi:acetyl-CoA carboxylase biotin carboxyl carrier protein